MEVIWQIFVSIQRLLLFQERDVILRSQWDEILNEFISVKMIWSRLYSASCKKMRSESVKGD